MDLPFLHAVYLSCVPYIQVPDSGSWFSWKGWYDAYKEIYRLLGGCVR